MKANIKKNSVIIRNKSYEICKRTVGIEQQIEDLKAQALGDDSQVKEYEFELSCLNILLGDAVVAELFPDINEIDLDELDTIYWQCVDKYNEARSNLKTARQNKQLSQITGQLGKVDGAVKNVVKLSEINKEQGNGSGLE